MHFWTGLHSFLSPDPGSPNTSFSFYGLSHRNLEVSYMTSSAFVFALLFVFALIVIILLCLRLYRIGTLQSNWRRTVEKESLKKERNRIAADIHDDIGAELTNLILLLRHLKQVPLKEEDKVTDMIERLEHSSIELIAKMNDVIWYLNTENHTPGNLFSYIRAYITSLKETSEIRIHLEITTEVAAELQLTADLPRNVFLMVKELVQNALKHSKASEISLRIVLLRVGEIRITYHDNGIGFSTSPKTPGHGMMNLHRRVYSGHGTIQVESGVNQGCHINIVLPVQLPNHESPRTYSYLRRRRR